MTVRHLNWTHIWLFSKINKRTFFRKMPSIIDCFQDKIKTILVKRQRIRYMKNSWVIVRADGNLRFCFFLYFDPLIITSKFKFNRKTSTAKMSMIWCEMLLKCHQECFVNNSVVLLSFFIHLIAVQFDKLTVVVVNVERKSLKLSKNTTHGTNCSFFYRFL